MDKQSLDIQIYSKDVANATIKEIEKMTKERHEALIYLADLPEKYARKIAYAEAEKYVYGIQKERKIRLTKHLYAIIVPDYDNTLLGILWRYVTGYEVETETKEEYEEKKKKGETAYWRDIENNILYVYYSDNKKEFIFCGENTKKEAIKWLAEKIYNYTIKCRLTVMWEKEYWQEFLLYI